MVRILIVVAVATSLASGALAATYLTSGDRFNACAKNETGQLRLVEDAGACLPSETAVSWSAGGGGTSFETVIETVAASPGLTTATATCPAGGRVVGGGAHADPVTGGNVLADFPAGEAAWEATAAMNPLARSLTVYAICATGG